MMVSQQQVSSNVYVKLTLLNKQQKKVAGFFEDSNDVWIFFALENKTLFIFTNINRNNKSTDLKSNTSLFFFLLHILLKIVCYQLNENPSLK